MLFSSLLILSCITIHSGRTSACNVHPGHEHRRRTDKEQRALEAALPTAQHDTFNGCAATISDEEQQILEAVYLDYKDTDEARRLDTFFCQIKVHFYLFLPSAGVADVSDNHLATMVETVNYGFRQAPFYFTKATTTRVIDATYAGCNNLANLQATYRVNANGELTVWMCDFRTYTKTNEKVEATGRSSFPTYLQYRPTEDGIILHNPGLLPGSQLNFFAQVLIHEAGHWLGGLVHTFQNGCQDAYGWIGWTDDNTSPPDQAMWLLYGDGIADTANHAQDTTKEPGKETCWYNANGQRYLDTCADDGAGGLDDGKDPVNNYMNYSTGPCFTLFGQFTPDQVVRISSVYDAWRSSNNGACSATSKPPASQPPITPLPTRAPSPQPTATCKPRMAMCKQHSQCCAAYKCVRISSNNTKKRCLPCRNNNGPCIVNDDCCSGQCRKKKKKCRGSR